MKSIGIAERFRHPRVRYYRPNERRVTGKAAAPELVNTATMLIVLVKFLTAVLTLERRFADV